MEGNACYKFSTIRHFIEKTGAPPIRGIVEVGVNIGSVSLLMHEYFPAARIVGFELVREYLGRSPKPDGPSVGDRALSPCRHARASVCRRPRRMPPTRAGAAPAVEGLAVRWPGLAGSMAVPADHEMAKRPGGVHGYELSDAPVNPITLREIFELTGFEEIDLVKIDCEGFEHSVLGCASAETLQRIRFIAGEYHGLQRFCAVMRARLFGTHKVNVIGDATMGAFFAERLDGERDGILRFNKDGMLQPRPWLCGEPIEWHIFNEAYVLTSERNWHALPASGAIEATSTPLSFAEFAQKVVAEAEPMSQNTAAGDLGFGWLYHGLVRNLRPDYVVAIGSCRGFMPFCAARGLQENGHGKLLFIDPSYSGNGHPGWSGRGLWSDARGVEGWIARFGLGGWMTHFKLTSAEAFPLVRGIVADGRLSLVVVDGAHTFEQSLQDFELYSSLMYEGFVVFHDATSEDCGVKLSIETLRQRGFPLVTIHREVGLSLVEIRPVTPVRRTWSYLCEDSDREALLLPLAQDLVRPGDHVLEAYCGARPLAPLLSDVSVFGFDADPESIRGLREAHPQHRWAHVHELSLPFSDLPERADVLIGLGLSLGHTAWDPQHAVPVVQFLLGRYFPRACLFETAADYHDGDVLASLDATLRRLGYRCRRETVSTQMRSFPRRLVLLAERAAHDAPHEMELRRTAN